MDVVEILNKLESMNLIRLNKITGNWYSVYCPFHSNGQEKRPSSGFLLQEEVRNGQTYPEGFFHCFTCQKAYTLTEAITEILKARGVNTKTGLEWLQENIPGFEEPEFDYLLPRDLVKALNEKYALNYLRVKSSGEKKYVPESELDKYRFTIDYMYERKLTDAVIEKFDVGVDLHYVPEGRVREVPCITFPVRDESGRVSFVCRRSIKYKNFFMPSGIEKPVYGVYELGSNRGSVVLCESIFNALTCYVYGVPALALFGTGTASQIKTLKLLGVKEFILGLDPDEAGDRGCKKLKRELKSVAIVRRMSLPSGKDINDLERDEFLTALRERV